MRRIWFAVALAFSVAGVGCGESTISKKDARAYVDKWSASVAKTLQRKAEGSKAVDQFRQAVKSAAADQEEAVDRSEPPYDVFVRDVYSELDWSLRLVARDGLSRRGEAVRAALDGVDAHALDPKVYPREAIAEQVEALDGHVADLKEARQFKVSDDARRAAVDYLTKQPVSKFELTEANYEKLTDTILAGEAGGRMKERVERLESGARQKAEVRARLEHLLARNAVRYSRQMRHFRVRDIYIHPREDDFWSLPQTDGLRPDRAKGPRRAGQVWRKAAQVADDMKEEVEILHRRMRRTLREVLAAEDAGQVLADLAPAHPDYAGLKEEYARYRKIVGDGGWKTVEPARIRPGDSGPKVRQIKERLATEGYFPADATDDPGYGDRLEEAVEAYQTTHQMKVTGQPHSVFWSSLNKPADYRLSQIALNMRRWRKSNVRHGDHLYVMVNIPGFTVEAWEGGELQMRFPIVVGNDDVKINEETDEKEHPNHTPLLSAYIDRVIYNPYWNVTDRIRREEILPKVRVSVESNYKAKLRGLRRRVKEAQRRKDAEPDTAKPPEEMETSEAGGPGAGGPGDDQMLVATGPNGGDRGSGAEGPAERQVGQPPADEASESAGVESGRGAADGGDGAKNKQENGKSTGGSEAKIEVSIDDLYRIGEKGPMGNKRVIFDVEAVRALVERVNRLEAEQKKATEGVDGEASETDIESEAPADAEGEEKDEESALAKAFPYLDPETGRVDLSETDPDHIPDWYEENDYEVMHPGTEWEYVRMTQGNHNALGRVKVIFPNVHSVYLHDTPKKALFSRNIRAFSHGCMRMEKPLEFAEFILKQDGKFGQVNLQKLLEGEEKKVEEDGEKVKKTVYEYKPIFLDKQIPVHIEYFTVRPDEKGRAQFFADIYDKDEDVIGKP